MKKVKLVKCFWDTSIKAMKVDCGKCPIKENCETVMKKDYPRDFALKEKGEGDV